MTKLQEGLDDIDARNGCEFKKRTADLKKKMQAKGEVCLSPTFMSCSKWV